MEQEHISGEEKQKARKEKLVREKGWFVPSIHGKYLRGTETPRVPLGVGKGEAEEEE
jgi:hypothetical protein